MTDIKLKAIHPDYCFITKDKVYSVEEIDEDGDYVIKDDDGDTYYVQPCEIGKDNEWEKISGFENNDLLNGDVVVMRNGYRYIFFKNYAGMSDALVNTEGGWMDPDNYEDDLLCSGDTSFDVMEVYRPQLRSTFYPAHDSLEDYKCVFKREDRKKMTVDEIESALGYKVAIVDAEGKEEK